MFSAIAMAKPITYCSATETKAISEVVRTTAQNRGCWRRFQ